MCFSSSVYMMHNFESICHRLTPAMTPASFSLDLVHVSFCESGMALILTTSGTVFFSTLKDFTSDNVVDTEI